MADQPTVNFSIAYWKPSGERHITPCEEDDPELSVIRVRASNDEIEFRKDLDPYMFHHHRTQLARLRMLMQAAFEQGRGAQAKIIRNALNPFG